MLAEQRLSEQEYLAVERGADHRSEYYAGRMFAMAGASEQHVTIVINVAGELRNQFKGGACRVYSSDLRVKVDTTGLYTYPDVAALGGEPRFEDEHVDTLLNPHVIVEVLSDSTEAYDRGQKFGHYRRLASLTDYVLISQHRSVVEHYSRRTDGQWLLTEISDLHDTLELPSIQCRLSLAEIYDNVNFPAASAPPAGHP